METGPDSGPRAGYGGQRAPAREAQEGASWTKALTGEANLC